MQKTINVLNTHWAGKWVAVAISESDGDYVIGKLKKFEWIITEEYKQTLMPKLKVIFSEVLEPGDPKESIIDVSTFSIKEYKR